MANLSNCSIFVVGISFIFCHRVKIELYTMNNNVYTLMIVDRELVHHVSSQEREMGHQWTCLNTKSFLVRIFLNMHFYTTMLYI